MAVLTLMLALAIQDAPKPAKTTPKTPARVAPPPSRTVPPAPPPMVLMSPPPPAPPPSSVPLPSAVPAERLGRKAVPRGSPQNWVSNDDYPAAALRAGQSGIVSFVLIIDDTGRVADCSITGSSGSELLDRTTCSLMRRRALFNPALDLAGNAVPSEWRSRFRWDLPEPELVPISSWTASIRFTITPAGRISSCSSTLFGITAKSADSTCAELFDFGPEQLRPLRGNSRGPVTILVRFDHVVEGTVTPASTPIGARFSEILSQRRTFSVDETGKPFECRQGIPDSGDSVPVTCPDDVRYDADGKRHAVTTRFALLTDGDRKISPDESFLIRLGE